MHTHSQTVVGRVLGGALLVTALVAGCASGSGSGPRELSVTTLTVSPPKLLVAKKSKRPLFIILDPEKVANKQGPVKFGFSRATVSDFQEFIRRDVADAMRTYFDVVGVLAPDAPRPEAPHMIADVRVDGVEPYIEGQYAFTKVRWAFAIRASEADDYMFSFAGESMSAAARSMNAMIESALENAISDLLKAWTDKEVHNKVLSLPAAGPSEAPETETDSTTDV